MIKFICILIPIGFCYLIQIYIFIKHRKKYFKDYKWWEKLMWAYPIFPILGLLMALIEFSEDIDDICEETRKKRNDT